MNASGKEPKTTECGMYLRSLDLEKFRSCFKTHFEFQPDLTLIVGENNSGKSNLIEALRLSTMPLSRRRTRYFEKDDFTHGHESDKISITTAFSNLSKSQRGRYLTALDINSGDCIYTYSYKHQSDQRYSSPTVHAGPGGGPDVEPELRDQICHVYLTPLRDAKRELDSSESIRLANTIEMLTSQEERDEFISEANNGLKQLESHNVIRSTVDKISVHVKELTQPVREQNVDIGFTDYRLRRLARGLRLKMAEAGIDPCSLSESGLGYANLTYIATVLLELESAYDAELTLLLVEEPEAHLHPQLQSVLLEYLMERCRESVQNDETRPAGRIQVIATTHSPNLASSVPIRNVVLLRNVGPLLVTRQENNCHSVPFASIGLTDEEAGKIGRYLDATKASMLFARSVILVEGIAEAILLPSIARTVVLPGLSKNPRLMAGITVIPIGGVDFRPYLKLLLTPYKDVAAVEKVIVVTDRDPILDEDREKATITRREQLLRFVKNSGCQEDILEVFESSMTLEADLISLPENHQVLEAAYLAQRPRSKPKWDEIAQSTNPAKSLYLTLQSNPKLISKGEFAQDIAFAIEQGTMFSCPDYIKKAIIAALKITDE